MLTFLVDDEVVQRRLVLRGLGQCAAVEVDVVRGPQDEHRVPTTRNDTRVLAQPSKSVRLDSLSQTDRDREHRQYLHIRWIDVLEGVGCRGATVAVSGVSKTYKKQDQMGTQSQIHVNRVEI